MTKAKKITPVDEGVLRSSGHVQLPVQRGSSVEVELGFGGPAGSGEGQLKDVGYAVYVHEDLTAYHPVGGVWKSRGFEDLRTAALCFAIDRVASSYLAQGIFP